MPNKYTVTGILEECLACHNPSDEAVRRASLKYIKADYTANCHLYTSEDRHRLAQYISSNPSNN